MRQRRSMNRGGAERGRHRIWNRIQAPCRQHRARREARTHGPWDHDLSRSRTPNRPSHPGAPELDILGMKKSRGNAFLKYSYFSYIIYPRKIKTAQKIDKTKNQRKGVKIPILLVFDWSVENSRPVIIQGFKILKGLGHLGGSVGWASNSWFLLRSWSQDPS